MSAATEMPVTEAAAEAAVVGVGMRGGAGKSLAMGRERRLELLRLARDLASGAVDAHTVSEDDVDDMLRLARLEAKRLVAVKCLTDPANIPSLRRGERSLLLGLRTWADSGDEARAAVGRAAVRAVAAAGGMFQEGAVGAERLPLGAAGVGKQVDWLAELAKVAVGTGAGVPE